MIIEQRGYAPTHNLVSTEWVEDHLEDSNLRIIESNEDPLLYVSGHIPGAVEVDWTRDLNDPLRRDYVDSAGFQALCERIGITPDTTLVFYGDKSNWWAAYALWVFSLFGHRKCLLMDGGRLKWESEGRPTSRESATVAPTQYPRSERDDSAIRAFRSQVLDHVARSGKLIDVRSPQEFSGERLHMADYPNEGALRGGHIPHAKNIPWARAVNPNTGEFRSAEELRALYEEEAGLASTDDVIVYCRIGERSAHTWFALKHLLGYQNVRNYDGSWTEWGNSVGLPIER
ncbi:MAG: sulfurtransferase [Armatimonadetes bacterium]|nr:sulfurtransferase [Armatimonadota bacterium]